jgi:hypothetical protein
VSKHPFKTEAELCAAYIEFAQRGGNWTAYPETEGWDILLVRNTDGFQIGVQAKMQFNMKVLAQAVESGGCYYRLAGPDCRAVLVPSAPDGASAVCEALGLSLIRYTGSYRYEFSPQRMPSLDYDMSWPTGRDWPEWSPMKRHQLPDYVPDVVAGSAAPIQLTKWKVAAIKLVALLHIRGFVTRADFKAIGLDHRRWLSPPFGYLDPAEDGRWVASSRLPDFEAQHPVVFPQVMAETAAQIGGAA